MAKIKWVNGWQLSITFLLYGLWNAIRVFLALRINRYEIYSSRGNSSIYKAVSPRLFEHVVHVTYLISITCFILGIVSGVGFFLFDKKTKKLPPK